MLFFALFTVFRLLKKVLFIIIAVNCLPKVNSQNKINRKFKHEVIKKYSIVIFASHSYILGTLFRWLKKYLETVVIPLVGIKCRLICCYNNMQ